MTPTSTLWSRSAKDVRDLISAAQGQRLEQRREQLQRLIDALIKQHQIGQRLVLGPARGPL